MAKNYITVAEYLEHPVGAKVVELAKEKRAEYAALPCEGNAMAYLLIDDICTALENADDERGSFGKTKLRKSILKASPREVFEQLWLEWASSDYATDVFSSSWTEAEEERSYMFGRFKLGYTGDE